MKKEFKEKEFIEEANKIDLEKLILKAYDKRGVMTALSWFIKFIYKTIKDFKNERNRRIKKRPESNN